MENKSNILLLTIEEETQLRVALQKLYVILVEELFKEDENKNKE